MRLVSTGDCSRAEGRVEVFYDGSWGTVCDDLWGTSDAVVVCVQLGLSYVGRAYSRAHFQRGVDLILLDDVRCRGDEADLMSCPHLPVGEHNCQHFEDAGVSCEEVVPVEMDRGPCKSEMYNAHIKPTSLLS